MKGISYVLNDCESYILTRCLSGAILRRFYNSSGNMSSRLCYESEANESSKHVS